MVYRLTWANADARSVANIHVTVATATRNPRRILVCLGRAPRRVRNAHQKTFLSYCYKYCRQLHGLVHTRWKEFKLTNTSYSSL